MNKKTGLGKGLSALIPDSITNPEPILSEEKDLLTGDESNLFTRGSKFEMVPVADIERNPYQPRTVFDDTKLTELATSIQEVGVLQPVLLRLQPNGYELIAGERRWLAARRAGLSVIPAVVRKVDDRNSLEQAVIENLHRSDLNPMEEAAAYHRLMDEFSMTQHQVAERVGKGRSSVANALRLLHLPAEVQRLIMNGEITAGHARCLAGLADRKIQENLAEQVVDRELSVRQLEEMVRDLQGVTPEEIDVSFKSFDKEKEADLLEVEEILSDRFDTKVQVTRRGKRGRIVIEYADSVYLQRIFDLLA